MHLTRSDIRKTKQDALESPRAEDLCTQGFTIEEVKRAVCVACGYIDGDLLRPFGSNSESPVAMSGRYVLQKNGRNYDAGHLCAKCMSSKETKA